MLACKAGEWVPPPVPLWEIPVSEECLLKFDAKDVTLTAVFAALYVVVNVVQMSSVGNPTVYGPVQLRVADCLIALTVLFGWPVVGGVTFGCLITNAYYFLGAQDVVFGPVANLVAATVVLVLRRRWFLACVAGAVPIGVIVGLYLSIFFPFIIPNGWVLGALPAVAAMVVSLTISSLIAVAGVGYFLVRVLSRSGAVRVLRSRGLK